MPDKCACTGPLREEHEPTWKIVPGRSTLSLALQVPAASGQLPATALEMLVYSLYFHNFPLDILIRI